MYLGIVRENSVCAYRSLWMLYQILRCYLGTYTNYYFQLEQYYLLVTYFRARLAVRETLSHIYLGSS